jgi:hypothetical protein
VLLVKPLVLTIGLGLITRQLFFVHYARRKAQHPSSPWNDLLSGMPEV